MSKLAKALFPACGSFGPIMLAMGYLYRNRDGTPYGLIMTVPRALMTTGAAGRIKLNGSSYLAATVISIVLHWDASTVIFVYSLGKYIYFKGLLLLIIAAIGESFVSFVYFGGVHWPNPLPLILYLSLVLLGHDRYRKLVATALLISSLLNFSTLLGLFLLPDTRNGGMSFYSFYFADATVEGYVGWRILLHGFVRFYLLGLRMDDKMRQSETYEDVREELEALRNALANSTEQWNELELRVARFLMVSHSAATVWFQSLPDQSRPANLNVFPLYNKSIESLSLDTPSGCMGECPWYSMKAARTGALEYRGIANVEVIGEQHGSINYYEFDLIASVVETSGFLDLPDDDDGACISTVGDTVIVVRFSDGQERVFTRDAMNEPPIFWAVAKLMEKLLEKAKWGQNEYDQAPVHFAARESG